MTDTTEDLQATISRLTAELDYVQADCLEANTNNARLTAERDGLRKALALIAEFKGRTIFSIGAEYRDGAHAAFEQAADIAICALAEFSTTSSVTSPVGAPHAE